MRKTILFLVLLLAGTTLRGQILISILLGDKLNSDKLEFGLEGGLNMSQIQGLDQAKTVSRLNLGFYFDFKLKNPAWMIHTGVLVKSSMGAEKLPPYDLNNASLNAAFAGGTVDRKLTYFNVPILMKHRFKSNFSLEAGPMLGLMAQSKDIFTNKVKDDKDLTYKVKIRDLYHPIDAGLMVGVGYRMMGGNGMNLGVRYYYGLVDITIDNSTPAQYNRTLYFSVGIPIGKGKKEVN